MNKIKKWFIYRYRSEFALFYLFLGIAIGETTILEILVTVWPGLIR